MGEREWWLRAALVLWDPRGVFEAMRRDGADERQEAAAALVGLAGLFAVLSTPRFAGLLDEPEVDGWSVAVFAFIGAAAYGFVGYFVLGAALKLASGAPYRLARHVVAYAAAPLALGVLFLWPVRLAAHGSDLFRAGGADEGADGTFFALADLGLALWSAGLLVAGARYAFRLSWARAAAVSVLPLTLAGLAVWLDRFQ
ncbi:MAG TPA: YIP1 family protein [Gaiellaceae bacterium]|nr:YIP1 family protein [Gaiellaceae bacterium]